MTKNRRSFLKAAGLAAGITSAAPLALTLQGTGIATGAAPGPRPATRGGFALELEGSVVGSLRGYSGGFPFGEVRLARIGTGPVDKAIAGVGFEDIRLEAGAALDASIWSWIGAMLSGSPTSKSGAILMMDGDYSLTHRLEFRDAYISEVTFPQFDGASKDAAFLTIGIAPERTEFKVAGGAGIPAGGRQKRWQASNFRLSIPGLPTETVSRVDAFTVRQVFTEERGRMVPLDLEYPNMALTLAEVDSGPWFDYFKEFVLNGDPVGEKDWLLEPLGPDLSVLFQIGFRNSGIFKCSLEKVDAASDNPARITVEMYVEQMTFESLA